MVTYGLCISVGLRLWEMSIIQLLLMMQDTRKVEMFMKEKIDIEVICNILTSVLISIFFNDISTLGTRVNYY